jgi:hypothetical protein
MLGERRMNGNNNGGDYPPVVINNRGENPLFPGTGADEMCSEDSLSSYKFFYERVQQVMNMIDEDVTYEQVALTVSTNSIAGEEIGGDFEDSMVAIVDGGNGVVGVEHPPVAQVMCIVYFSLLALNPVVFNGVRRSYLNNVFAMRGRVPAQNLHQMALINGIRTFLPTYEPLVELVGLVVDDDDNEVVIEDLEVAIHAVYRMYLTVFHYGGNPTLFINSVRSDDL